MRPALSFLGVLAGFGAAFSFIHWFSLALGLPDLVALMLFALPVIAYIAYCTQDSPAAMLRAGTITYTAFAAILLACAGLVYLIA